MDPTPAARVRSSLLRTGQLTVGRREPLVSVAVKAANYVTNHVIARIPSFSVRHAWYKRYLGLQVGEGARIHLGCYMWHFSPGRVRQDRSRIGAGTWINRGVCLDLRGGLDIGEAVSISPEVLILTASHAVNDVKFRLTLAPVTIGNHVFIGSRAIIMPGVRLGRGCVVAAGAIVTRDVEPLAIVGGSPARQIGIRDEAAVHYPLGGPMQLFE